ncbi:MAG: N-acetyltransferase family protein [Comamonadaceae bacterium]|nr:MAG: N-acetyltransferase family protein [Comamonadaceae bacterium]
MQIVDCSYAAHAPAILAILNESIVNSTAVYDYAPRPPESMVGWFRAKEQAGFPVLGAMSESGELMGFASYGTFRAWPAYKYSVEHSVYVHQGHRRKGVARLLMQQLVARARQQELHAVIGGIDMDNRASIALHESLGFSHAGTIRQAGYKFGRWLDLGFYQLLLETPLAPRDG